MTHDISRRTGRAGNRSEFTITETWTGRVIEMIKRTTRQRAFLPESEVVYPVIIDADIDEDIVDSVDDVFESGGGIDIGTNYNVIQPGTYGGNAYTVGVRFRVVALAVDATVDLATLTYNVTARSGTPDNDLFGIQKDVPVWSDTAGEGSNDQSPLTAASVSLDEAGTGVKTITVTAIVQEILDDTTGPAWATGDDMGFVTRNNASTGSDNFIDTEDLSAAGTDHWKLAIDFTAAGGLGIPIAAYHYEHHLRG